MFIEPLESRTLFATVPDFGNITVGNQSFQVGLIRADGATAEIDPNQQTWVVIHGWNSSPALIDPLADAIAANPNRQVLEFDWSSAASTSDVATAALRVPQVSKFVARRLRGYGIASNNINLVGHSLGGYMADRVARRLTDGVNRIIALDPATIDVLGFNISGTDFAGHSRYSSSFVGSNFATPVAAFTADETIHVDVGPPDQIQTHLNVLDLFTTIMQQNSSGSPDPISRIFSIRALKAGRRPNWVANGEGDGYEALLVGQFSNDHWSPQSLTYIDASTSQPVTISA